MILPRKKHGTPAKNFHYLFESCDFSSFDYVGLSDQDDIWFLDKLYRAHLLLESSDYCAYSSDIIAKYINGKEKYIKKSHPIKKYDYLFESAGPGCSYIIKTKFIFEYVSFIKMNRPIINDINCHDWTIYAYMRSNGNKWFIDSTPSLFYRQHESNAEGANLGFLALLNRLKSCISGEYRQRCLSILNLNESNNLKFKNLLNGSWFSNLQLLMIIGEIRRSPKTRSLMAILLLFGFFR